MILLQQLLTLDQDLHGQVRGQRFNHVLQLAATADLLRPQDGALAQGTQGLGLGLAPGQQAGTAQQVATGQHLGAGEGLMAHRAVQLTHLICCYSCCGCGCGCGHVCPCHMVPGEQGPFVLLKRTISYDKSIALLNSNTWNYYYCKQIFAILTCTNTTRKQMLKLSMFSILTSLLYSLFPRIIKPP